MDSLPLRIINAVTNVLVGVIVVFALLIVAGKPFGIHAYAVLSGSMEPAYHTGSLIYVKEVKPSTLGQGDVITFMTGKDTTVTHRIVDGVQGEDGVTRLQTQGDANSSPDGDLVHPDNVIGTPVFQIPSLGYVVNFIQYPPGAYIAVSVCALAVFLMFLPDLFTKGDEDGGEGAEGDRSNYARQPRGLQAAHPAHAASSQQGCGMQGRPAQAFQSKAGLQTATGQQHMPRPVGQVAARPQQVHPVQRVADRPQQDRSVGQQRMPQQIRPARQQVRPAQSRSVQQERLAQDQSAQHPSVNSRVGTNNPRNRNNQTVRSAQNVPQTNPSQGSPARRPVS